MDKRLPMSDDIGLGVPESLEQPARLRSVKPAVAVVIIVVFSIILGVALSALIRPRASANPIQTVNVHPSFAASPGIPLADPTPFERPRATPTSFFHATPAGYVHQSSSSGSGYAPQQVAQSDHVAPPTDPPVQHTASPQQMRALETAHILAAAQSGGTDVAFSEGKQDQPIVQASAATGYIAPSSEDEVVRGTRFTARLDTTVDSSVSGGLAVAHITQDVYDSKTRTVLVIPAGTVVVGKVESAEMGASRLIASWDELQFPNGDRFAMGANPGAGMKGEAGQTASVDYHTGRAFGQALMHSFLQAGVALAGRGGTNVNVGSAVQQQQQLAPTMHAYGGQAFLIFVARDLPLRAYAP